jgi:uncharacterized repeat protein (TIGR03803 family)
MMKIRQEIYVKKWILSSSLGKPFLTLLIAASFSFSPNSSEGTGVSVVNLHSFGLFADGTTPYSTLVQGVNGSFYGTTFAGGADNAGVIFEVASNGAASPLYAFTNGVDGAFPQAGLLLANDGNFYGTTVEGGTNGTGSIFKITPAGVFSPLYSFTALPANGVNADGANPAGSLIQAKDGNLYGTASTGGTNGSGTLFKIGLGGSFQLVYAFTALNTDGDNVEGSDPEAPLIQGSDGNFYGTADSGGASGLGSVFEYNVSQSQISLLYAFTGNGDGANPLAALVQGTDGSFYGTTSQGGSNTYGAIFKIISGGAFLPLYSFTNGADGANPAAPLAQSANGNLYGTSTGPQDGFGTIFEMTTNGAVMPLYALGGGNDGAYPTAGLVQAGGGVFYGTASAGGTNNSGAVFSITPEGVFAPVMSFVGGDDGESPQAPLLQATNGVFYGTTFQGGSVGEGTIFQITSNGVFTSLYSFTNGSDGNFPAAGLTLGADENLYGTTMMGGGPPNYGYNGDVGVFFDMTPQGSFTVLDYFSISTGPEKPRGNLLLWTNGDFYGTTYSGFNVREGYAFGTIFQMTPQGELTTLYSFTNGFDGAYPQAGLSLGADGNFYGTATAAGSPVLDVFPTPTNNFGTIFKVTPSGVLTPLHHFTNGMDGGVPMCQLVQLAGGNFYGTASTGGTNDHGTVFMVTPSGSFAPLYSFTNGIDGAAPNAGLAIGPDGNLYGTAAAGGAYGLGTIFEITSNGGFTALYSFQGAIDGSTPVAPLVLGTDGNFYGTTSLGGAANDGAIFKLVLSTTPAPSFTSIIPGPASITLSWNTVPGQLYQLQVSANLSQNAWANLGAPVNGTNGAASFADTNVGYVQRYYRVISYAQ